MPLDVNRLPRMIADGHELVAPSDDGERRLHTTEFDVLSHLLL